MIDGGNTIELGFIRRQIRQPPVDGFRNILLYSGWVVTLGIDIDGVVTRLQVGFVAFVFQVEFYI